MTNPKNHPLWPRFKEWVDSLEFQIGLEHEEDWLDFWKCFLAGAQASIQTRFNLTLAEPTETNA